MPAVSYLVVIMGFLWLPSTPLCGLQIIAMCAALRPSEEAKPVLLEGESSGPRGF